MWRRPWEPATAFQLGRAKTNSAMGNANKISWAPCLTRRTTLVLAVTAVMSRNASTQPVSGDMAANIIALATDANIMTLDPEAILRRVAFRGGTARGGEEANRAVWDLRDEALTLGHIELSRGLNGWRVDALWLLFEGEDVPLTPLRDAFTKHFGMPRNETMSPQSSTVLRWRGADRSVQVTADVPADRELWVYAVRIGRP